MQNHLLTKATIELHGLTFHARHGVLPEENLLGNTFTVDLNLEANINNAIITDKLDETINYAEAYEVVAHEMNIPSQLLEHVCGRICIALLNHFPTLQQVQARVAKHNPPIKGSGPCLSAVTLTYSKSNLP